MKRQLKLGSLFDGIAGFPLAAVRHGIKPVWASEIVQDCVDITEKHFPEMEQLGDITKIDGAGIQPVDIISFGSPCQNLSTAGNQRGLDGEKSSLFFEAVRIIYEMRGATNGQYPKYVIWENVAGAFSSNKGQDFRRVLEEITKTYIPMPNSGKWAAAGMVRSRGGSTAWRQLDAQYWGVPQRRKRIYLVHCFDTECAGKILFECESVYGNYTEGKAEGQRASEGIGRSTEPADKMAAGFLYKAGAKAGSIGFEEQKSPTVMAGQMPAVVHEEEMVADLGPAGDKIYINAKKSVTLKATDGGGGAATGIYLLPVYAISGNAMGRNGKNGGNQLGINEHISYTLTAADRHAVVMPEAYKVSRIAEYKSGIGTLRASGGDNGAGSETLIVEKELQFMEAYQHHGYRESEVANTLTAGANSSVRGDTSFVVENERVIAFDDAAENEDGSQWACMCRKCVERYGIDSKYLDEAGQGICSVAGCMNKADFYIDFPSQPELKGFDEEGNVVTYRLKQLVQKIRYRARRLMPVECERLDGFPDGWTLTGASGKEMSDTTRYTALGNSIAIPCAERVFIGILAAEQEGKE